MQLERYLQRIGCRLPPAPTLEVLTAVHRSHLLAISYENLDLHLGHRLDLDPARFFDKLVNHRRGGWCYEMNGLFAWALEKIGFDVTLVAGAVHREILGDAAEGNHLVIVVRLDRVYLVDVGFGDGFLEPIPLEEGRYRQGWLEYGLERAGGRWVFRNQEHGAAKSYDFTLEPRRLQDFAARCHELQTSPSSGFVQKTVCQRFTEAGIVTLRGAVLRKNGPAGNAEHLVTSESEYARLLEDEFGLEVGGVAGLWSRVWTRHQAWAGHQPTPPAS